MSKVIAYKNTDRVSVCQIRFDSGEKVLVSFANNPAPSFRIMKLLFGIVPLGTVWEFELPAGFNNSYDKMLELLSGSVDKQDSHPLDFIISKLLPCRSCAEALDLLREVEMRIA